MLNAKSQMIILTKVLSMHGEQFHTSCKLLKIVSDCSMPCHLLQILLLTSVQNDKKGYCLNPRDKVQLQNSSVQFLLSSSSRLGKSIISLWKGLRKNAHPIKSTCVNVGKVTKVLVEIVRKTHIRTKHRRSTALTTTYMDWNWITQHYEVPI